MLPKEAASKFAQKAMVSIPTKKGIVFITDVIVSQLWVAEPDLI